jgi:hypothetical protein
MNDKFETFVKETSENCNETFREKEIAWKGIEQKLHRNKTRKLYIRISAAATILILMATGAIFFNSNMQAKLVSGHYTEISTELSEMEFYFTGLVEQQQQQIFRAGPYNKEFFKPFFDEINQLDEQYETYRNELKKFGCQEELIRAMIENQQQKLEILNRLLSEIIKIKNYEKRKLEHQI